MPKCTARCTPICMCNGQEARYLSQKNKVVVDYYYLWYLLIALIPDAAFADWSAREEELSRQITGWMWWRCNGVITFSLHCWTFSKRNGLVCWTDDMLVCGGIIIIIIMIITLMKLHHFSNSTSVHALGISLFVLISSCSIHHRGQGLHSSTHYSSFASPLRV